jgi:hypothetical protein
LFLGQKKVPIDTADLIPVHSKPPRLNNIIPKKKRIIRSNSKPVHLMFSFEDILFIQEVLVTQVQFLFLAAALKLLGEKTTLLSPEVVVASGIPCCRSVDCHICYAVMS